MAGTVVEEMLPELDAFAHAVRTRSPKTGTWCEAWTVRDIVIHQTGTAEELARVLGAHLAGSPVPTRRFEEREASYRALDDADLWSAFLDRCARLAELTRDAERTAPPETTVVWTGRTVSVPFFAEHLREELVLHRWDVTGDDATAVAALGQPWMVRHSVADVGKPLLGRGLAALDRSDAPPVEGRLRVPGADDVLVRADGDGGSIEFAAADGPATLETDEATRTLLLWGRRPADPSRIRSDAGPEELGRLRLLLSGY
jgi:hypothetical protein